MADNKVIDNGTLTDVTWATDEIGGVDYQRVKISVGADGTANDVQPPDANGKASSSILPSGGQLWNGASWDRMTSATEGMSNTGLLGAAPMLNNGASANYPQRSAYADGVGLAYSAGSTPMLYNGSTVDRQRGNLEGTLLASAARTTSTNSPVQINYNHRGVAIIMRVTAAGTGTLTPSLQWNDPIISGWGIWTVAANITTTSTFAWLFYPGVVPATPEGWSEVTATALPRSWFFAVTHSDASSWTYSAAYALIV